MKEKGAWKLLKVEEEESSAPLASIAALGELEWLIGDWVDQDDSGSVETTFRWTKDYAFINGKFRVTVGDRVDLEGTQVIGWDPVGKKIRSWIFDTKAGFGEGEWSSAGNQWTVKVKSTLGTAGRKHHPSTSIIMWIRTHSPGSPLAAKWMESFFRTSIRSRLYVKNAQKAQAKSGK